MAATCMGANRAAGDVAASAARAPRGRARVRRRLRHWRQELGAGSRLLQGGIHSLPDAQRRSARGGGNRFLLDLFLQRRIARSATDRAAAAGEGGGITPLDTDLSWRRD